MPRCGTSRAECYAASRVQRAPGLADDHGRLAPLAAADLAGGSFPQETGQRMSSILRRWREALSARLTVAKRSGADGAALAAAARPTAAMVVTSQCCGTANSAARPARSNARNCRTCRPSAWACTVRWATAWPRSYSENSEYSQSVPSTYRCARLAISRLAAGAQEPELRARYRARRAWVASPRWPTMNAHGWELPADGAHRAASRSASISDAASS